MEGLLVLGDNLKSPIGHPTMYLYQNIYITSDDEIKEGDITIYGKSLFLVESILHKSGPFRHLNPKIKIQGRFLPDMTIGKFDSLTPLKKIILTTDPDFGVQSIDDEFLEWFVKNPSCEEVFITDDYEQINQENPITRGSTNVIHKYKIIIPQEEPKQETTLEEAVNNFKKTDVYINEIKQEQDKKLYSEEDMNEYADYCWSFSNDNRYKSPLSPKEWFEQFKKK
jgi:hypothetical protein